MDQQDEGVEVPLQLGTPSRRYSIPPRRGSDGGGLVQVYTGDGKGKTTAALGLALRAAGHGYKVHIVQFMKGKVLSGAKGWPNYGELEALRHLPNITLVQFGRAAFVDSERPEPEDVRLAQEAWQHSLDVLRDGRYDVMVLDEINVALDFGLISLSQVMELLDARPSHVELVLTGRRAHPRVIERADLVTEMRAIKHPYDAGVAARKGVEY